VSGEKTVYAGPLLGAKIVSVVSTSLLQGVGALQDLAKSGPFRNSAMAGPRFPVPASSGIP
jgi:hypothetical protein